MPNKVTRKPEDIVAPDRCYAYNKVHERRESPAVTITWLASKYIVYNLYQRYMLVKRNPLSPPPHTHTVPFLPWRVYPPFQAHLVTQGCKHMTEPNFIPH